MNKKMIAGALFGALVLIAVIVVAAPVYAATASTDGATEGTAVNGSNGDCDQTKDQAKDQDRDRLKDGSCENCPCATADGTAAGAASMNQETVQVEAQQTTMTCASNGDGPYGNCYRCMEQNGKA